MSLSVQISSGKAITPAQIRDAVYEVLKDAGVDVVKADTSLTIKAAGGEQLKSVRIYTTTGIGGAFRAPAYVAKYGNVDYNK